MDKMEKIEKTTKIDFLFLKNFYYIWRTKIRSSYAFVVSPPVYQAHTSSFVYFSLALRSREV